MAIEAIALALMPPSAASKEALADAPAEALAESEPLTPRLAAADAEADAPKTAPSPTDKASARLAAPAGIENEIGGKLRSASSLPNCELQTQGMGSAR